MLTPCSPVAAARLSVRRRTAAFEQRDRVRQLIVLHVHNGEGCPGSGERPCVGAAKAAGGPCHDGNLMAEIDLTSSVHGSSSPAAHPEWPSNRPSRS